MVILADDMSNDFEKFKSSTSMIKSDAENAEELLDSIIENMELETNLSSKIRVHRWKDIAEIFDQKVVVGSQKTKLTIKVEKIKNTKNTFKVFYDIELPNRPIFTIFVLLGLFLGIIGAIIIYFVFCHSDAKKIQMAFPMKSIMNDAIEKVVKEDVEQAKHKKKN